jgi:hypothetical protein
MGVISCPTNCLRYKAWALGIVISQLPITHYPLPNMPHSKCKQVVDLGNVAIAFKG